MQIKRELRLHARAMRAEGKSLSEIAKALQVAKSSVSSWVRDIGLTDAQIEDLRSARKARQAAQNMGARANRENALRLRQTWQAEGRQAARENRPLHRAGCMLYWAEGAKDRGKLLFVNTDVEMIRFFVRFLREELSVVDENIILRVHCHDQPSPQVREIEQFWLSSVNLPETQLRKTHIKGIGESRRNKLIQGVCVITVHSTQLTQHVFGAIQEYAGFDRPEWLG
jgi:predicted transcriptional regulator